jgi:hypothetical protein
LAENFFGQNPATNPDFICKIYRNIKTYLSGGKKELFSKKKIYKRNLAEKLFWSESSNKSGCFQKLDTDPVKNCPDPHRL